MAMLLQSCAAPPEKHYGNAGAEVLAQATQTQTEEPQLADPAPEPAPEAATDAEVMYNVFAGELLGSEGDLEGAVSAYLQAAMESDDPAIAQRATRVALAAQSWFQAAMAANRWALLAPDDMAAREAAAATMLATHDYAGAELQLEQILERNPDKEDAWVMVSSLLAQAADPAKANEVLERLLEDRGGMDNANALFLQAQLLARMGEFGEAARLADEALELTPDRIQLLTFSGRLALNLEDLDKAVERFGRAWEFDPENHDLALAYSDLLARAARADEARAVMESMDQTADVLLSRVLFEISAEEPEKAKALYAEFDELETQNPDQKAYFQGQAAEAIGERGQAIALYGMIDEGEYLMMAGIRRAELIAEAGDVDAARQALETLRAKGDEAISEQAWLAEARLLRQAEQLPEAFQALGRALENFGYSVPIRYSHALLAAELGNVEVAEYDLRIVLADEPDNAAALNALGYTLADQTDRYEEAADLIHRAYELQPNDASIIDSMGWVAYRLGRLEESEGYLRQAWELDKNPEIAAHLGEVLWAMGREDAAIGVWREGLSVDSEHPVLAETLQRMGVEL
jgi:tetratricopeptide (TPR) repeat protein